MSEPQVFPLPFSYWVYYDGLASNPWGSSSIPSYFMLGTQWWTSIPDPRIEMRNDTASCLSCKLHEQQPAFNVYILNTILIENVINNNNHVLLQAVSSLICIGTSHGVVLVFGKESYWDDVLILLLMKSS